MKPSFMGKAALAAAALMSFSMASCVRVNNELGASFIPLDQMYDIYTAEFPLETISMKPVDSLSGYSSTRMTFGAIRDEVYGLTTRSTALSLFPISDTLDFGKNAKLRYFHFTAEHDTSSFSNPDEEYILQNINVYELENPMDFTLLDLNTQIKHKDTRITDGIPVYKGRDSLSFNFNRAFAEKFLTITQDDLKDMETYLKKFPGIYITTDEPRGNGGRINMFDLQLGVNTNYGYISRDFAELAFTAEYDGVKKDTSFLFYFSPAEKVNLDSLVEVKQSQGAGYTFPQYCFNSVTHESGPLQGVAQDILYVEGGAGLKPVVQAEELLKLMKEEIGKHGDPAKAVVSRATVVMPFEFPEDYTTMYMYPEYLNPTMRVSTEKYVSYGSLSDTSDRKSVV